MRDFSVSPLFRAIALGLVLFTGACSGDETADSNCPVTGKTSCSYPGVKSSLYEPSQVIKERSCVDAEVQPSDIIEDCEWGSMCFQDPEINNGEATCHRSIDASQSSSPYYNFGCSQFSMWMRTPTGLEMDCRCRDVGDGQGGTGGTGNAMADPNNTDITMGARPGGPIMNCAQMGPQEDQPWPIQYGTGPSFNAWKQQNSSGASWFSGAVDPTSREMYAIIKWTSPQNVKSATVVAWNLDTKDRRVISGLHPQEGAFGSGYESPQPNNRTPLQPLTGANVLRIGPDKMIYTYGGGTGESTDDQREIVKIDPATGERTLVWKAQNEDTGVLTDTFGQCLRPNASLFPKTVGLNAQAFEVGPDGKYYMGFRGVREGDGIIEISADGKTCSFLSNWGGIGHNQGGGVSAPPLPDRGAGPMLQFPVQGLLFHDGVVYGVSNSDLFSFDAATGDRALVSYAGATYGGMGFSNMFWDSTRNVIWAVGTVASYVGTIVDPTTGRRESIYGDSGMEDYGDDAILKSDYGTPQSVGIGTLLSNGHSINYGGVVLDPADPNIVYAVLKSGGLMKMELSTFNNYVYSW